jgi:hypothetical protein
MIRETIGLLASVRCIDCFLRFEACIYAYFFAMQARELLR